MMAPRAGTPAAMEAMLRRKAAGGQLTTPQRGAVLWRQAKEQAMAQKQAAAQQAEQRRVQKQQQVEAEHARTMEKTNAQYGNPATIKAGVDLATAQIKATTARESLQAGIQESIGKGERVRDPETGQLDQAYVARKDRELEDKESFAETQGDIASALEAARQRFELLKMQTTETKISTVDPDVAGQPQTTRTNTRTQLPKGAEESLMTPPGVDADKSGIPDSDSASEGALKWLRETKAVLKDMSVKEQAQYNAVAEKLKTQYPKLVI